MGCYMRNAHSAEGTTWKTAAVNAADILWSVIATELYDDVLLWLCCLVRHGIAGCYENQTLGKLLALIP